MANILTSQIHLLTCTLTAWCKITTLMWDFCKTLLSGLEKKRKKYYLFFSKLNARPNSSLLIIKQVSLWVAKSFKRV